jgi:hypothetical protein
MWVGWHGHLGRAEICWWQGPLELLGSRRAITGWTSDGSGGQGLSGLLVIMVGWVFITCLHGQDGRWKRGSGGEGLSGLLVIIVGWVFITCLHGQDGRATCCDNYDEGT